MIFFVAARVGVAYDCVTIMVTIALLLVMLQSQAPAVPAIVSDPHYPLHVQLAQTGAGSSGLGGRVSSWGHGNVLGTPPDGFDYAADCNERFAFRPEGNQYFPARWNKPRQRLEILIQEYGSDRITACELKVAMREEAYDLNPSMPRASLMTLAKPAVPVTEPDAKFPMRVQLWVLSSGTSSLSGSHAEGYGNIQGATLTGFDFGNTCPVRLSMGHGGDMYQARWVEQGLKMEILVQEVGTRQESVCLMDVGLKDAPYSAPLPSRRPVAPAKKPSPQAPTYNSDAPPPER
jgi:hypothetical protein